MNRSQEAILFQAAEAGKQELKLDFNFKRMGSFPNVPPSKQTKDIQKPIAPKITKLSPDYDCSLYDTQRQSVETILSISTKFELASSRSKGIVLKCGSDDPQAKDEGFATCILPLKTMITCPSGATYVDNPLIGTLAKYAAKQQGEEPEDDDLPELILGLCCNNWGMYYGRNALIEALLEVLGPSNTHKLSIHSALYALDINTHALSHIVLSETTTPDSEQEDRALHAAAFEASAAKYGIELDAIENTSHLGVSKADFVQELYQATAQAVERTMASDGKSVTGYVMEILRLRCLIQENLTKKKFRRAPSQNAIATASQRLTDLFADNFGDPELFLAHQLPGWKAYSKSSGGPAQALLGLFGHSLDVLAGCVARSSPKEITPDLAERLVLTALDPDHRCMEYCFNQIYELMPTGPPKTYLYRRLGDLSLFSTMDCGAVEMGAKL